MNSSTLIRKIVVGSSPKDGLAYKVGNPMGPYVIASIELDERALALHNIERYLVHVQDDKGNVLLWKQISGANTLLEFDIDM
jgi:hypothetical protein|tara:strand:+ start:1459 stop:1704 length:246 start_codon:yes stop_codon:yes gene_type:complete